MKRKYSQLSYEERIAISTLQTEGYGVRAIARTLGRSPNTVSYELRNKQVCGTYNPRKAHQKTYQKRYRSKRMCLKVAMDRFLEKEVRTQLRKRVSPERISGYLRRCGTVVSAKAVRKYAQSRSMEYCFFWSWNKKKGGPKRRQHRAWDQLKRHVSERPVTTCSGHWEVDFMVSKASPAVLMVLVDRWTRFVIIKKLERKTHESVSRVFAEVRKYYDMKTVTTDNDIVFQKWLSMEAFLGVPFYFTTPYTSQEKGLVENTNRWIRCFVPKKRDMRDVTDDELRSIESYLNDVPRQCLDFYTARELFIHRRVS
jgi:IS30 family transposase